MVDADNREVKCFVLLVCTFMYAVYVNKWLLLCYISKISLIGMALSIEILTILTI